MSVVDVHALGSSGAELKLDGGQLTEITEEDVGLLVKDSPGSNPIVQDGVQSATLPLLENEERGTEDDAMASKSQSDPSSDFTWVGLLWFYLAALANGALEVAEYLGEKLADLFGITSPRYPYIAEELERQRIRQMKAEQEEEEEVLRHEAALTEQLLAAEEGRPAPSDSPVAGSPSTLHLDPVATTPTDNFQVESQPFVQRQESEITMDDVDLEAGQQD